MVISRLVLGWLVVFAAAVPLHSPHSSASDWEDTVKSPSCGYCGMDRVKFAHSRLYITYSDGSETGVCSLHCAALDLALNLDKYPTEILVGDFNSHQLIVAETSFWVIGGARTGVMTRRPKWAFSRREEAEEFITQNGGVMSDFEKALRATFEDLYDDVQMIREERKSDSHQAPSVFHLESVGTPNRARVGLANETESPHTRFRAWKPSPESWSAYRNRRGLYVGSFLARFDLTDDPGTQERGRCTAR